MVTWHWSGVFAKQCLICPLSVSVCRNIVLTFAFMLICFHGFLVAIISAAASQFCTQVWMAIVTPQKKQWISFIGRGPSKSILSVCGMCVRPEGEIREKWGTRAWKRARVGSGVIYPLSFSLALIQSLCLLLFLAVWSSYDTLKPPCWWLKLVRFKAADL